VKRAQQLLLTIRTGQARNLAALPAELKNQLARQRPAWRPIVSQRLDLQARASNRMAAPVL
jgi:hypothetical protein